jgi:hypothetical protein
VQAVRDGAGRAALWHGRRGNNPRQVQLSHRDPGGPRLSPYASERGRLSSGVPQATVSPISAGPQPVLSTWRRVPTGRPKKGRTAAASDVED